MPSPSFEEGQAPAPVTQRDAARAVHVGCLALDHDSRIIGRRTSRCHTRDPSCRAPLTRDHPQACEPRCADVFKHYLACADRIEQKGAGTAAASRIRASRAPRRGRQRRRRTTARRAYTPSPRPHNTPSPRPHTKKKRAGDCEPYYFDWLKCIDKCAMPHIMQKLK